MTVQVVRCPACAGKLGQPLPSTCPYCKAALALSVTATPQAAAQLPHAVLAERFAAAERDPSIIQLMAREPVVSAPYMQSGAAVLFGIVFVAFVLFSLSLFHGVEGLPGGLTLVPVLMLIVAVAMVLVALVKVFSHASSPLLRRIGHVADERLQVSGGSGDRSSSTSYFATLDFADGSRAEYQVTHDVAGRIAPGDVGVTYVKGKWLLDFERLKA